MREIIKLGLILLLITSISAVVLGLTYEVTKDTVEEAEALENEKARTAVLPSASTFEEVDIEEITTIVDDNPNLSEVYKGVTDSGEVVGYAIKTATPGYGGNVQLITGISTEGKITGMNVVSHLETPGLGANATKPEFQDQFRDKPTDDTIGVVKSTPKNANEIQALTGATITSKAVVDGVNIARELYIDNLQ